MKKTGGIAIITIVILFGILLQILLYSSDAKDSPNKAVAEFCSAYFKADEAMTKRLSSQSRFIDDIDIVDTYLWEKSKEASDRGFGLFFLQDKLYHINTSTLNQNGNTARVRITGGVKPLFRSFFTGETYTEIDNIFDVIKEDGKWKVCGKPFSILKG